MKWLTHGRLILTFFTLGYGILGAIYLVREGNHEFLWYLVLLIPLVALAFYLQVRYDLPLWMLWLISILGALHLAGGSIIVHGEVLYNLVLVPIPNWTGLTLWKFDQLVHPYGGFVVGLSTYALLNRSGAFPRLSALLVAFMVANGAGALNEVNEFATKIVVPATDVGGYYNTALDLFFNMLGAILGSVIGYIFIKARLDTPSVSG